MKNWHVTKDSNCYRFHSKGDIIGTPGIHELSVYVFDISQNRRTETHATTYNLETYKKILDEGRQHAAEKSEGLAKKRTYYFDSTYHSFERMNDKVREKFFSESRIMSSFLERSLSHCEPFDEDDAQGCANNIEESLSVLTKADKNVEEIIDYMNEELAPKSSFSPR